MSLDAYDRVLAEADAANAAILQTELAHPFRPSDYWTTRDQADLEAAALLMQNAAGPGLGPGRLGDWWGVGYEIMQAANAMSSPDTSAVDREEALLDLYVACLGRSS